MVVCHNIQWIQKSIDINYGSVAINNLTEKLSGHRSAIEPLESRIISMNNYTTTDLENYLVDYANKDFRPINEPQIVNQGNTS